MTYLKYTPYLYLIVGLYLIYHGVSNLNNPNETPMLSLGLAVFTIFMFFFRRKYAKRFEARKNNQN